MTNLSPGSMPFITQYKNTAGALPHAGLGWLDVLRDQGIKRFEALGLPTPAIEDWKYTRLRPLEDTEFQKNGGGSVADKGTVVPSLFKADKKHPKIVFVNGQLCLEKSNLDHLPDGLIVRPTLDMLKNNPDWFEKRMGSIVGDSGRAMQSLNAALLDGGYVIAVDANVHIEHPIEIIFLRGGLHHPVCSNPRNFIDMGLGSSATVISHHSGLGVGAYFANAVTEINVADGAHLNHYRVQDESKDATHLLSVHVDIGRDATYESFGLSVGGRLSRTEVHARLLGRGGHTAINGAYLMRGDEHCDNTTVIDHLAPDTTSREVFKGVLDDQSRAVFQGKIVVHKDAQRINGHQLSKALLLSDAAEMDAKPELEIYADDVKCSHGATTGQLDETELFYLRSRGIPEAQARNMLIRSFLAEAVQEINDQDIQEAMIERVMHWLPAQCFLASEWTKP